MPREEKLLDLARNQLLAGEVVRAHTRGGSTANVAGRPMKVAGIVIVTDQRIGHFAKWPGGSQFRSIRFENITAISNQKNALGLMTLEITSSNELIVVSSVKDSEGAALLKLVDVARSKLSGGASAQVASEIPSVLVELASLRDRGIITPDEFEAKKRELLERM